MVKESSEYSITTISRVQWIRLRHFMYHACLDRRLRLSRLFWSPGPVHVWHSIFQAASRVEALWFALHCPDRIGIAAGLYVADLCAISSLNAYADSRMTETSGNRKYKLSKPGIFCFCFSVTCIRWALWEVTTVHSGEVRRHTASPRRQRRSYFRLHSPVLQSRSCRKSSKPLAYRHLMTSTCPVSQTPNVRSHHPRQACTATFISKSGLQVHFCGDHPQFRLSSGSFFRGPKVLSLRS